MQVKHPVAPDDHVGILQQVLCVDRPKVAFAGPEHDGHEVHADLVDQARGQHLAADVTGGDLDDAVSGELLRLAMAASTPSTKWNGAAGCGRWVTTTTWSIPLGGLPSQPSVRSKTWRPTSVAPIWSQYGRM